MVSLHGKSLNNGCGEIRTIELLKTKTAHVYLYIYIHRSSPDNFETQKHYNNSELMCMYSY